MSDLFGNLVTLCGFGLLGCCGVIVGGGLLLVVTGRAMILPAIGSLIGQLFGGVGELFGGNDEPKEEDYEDEPPRRAGSAQSMSAAERIRARRDRFKEETNRGQLAPRRPGDDDDDLRPSGKRWRQGGRRGPIERNLDITEEPRKPEGYEKKRRLRRDSRKREANDDEIFGGMLDDDGDGYADY